MKFFENCVEVLVPKFTRAEVRLPAILNQASRLDSTKKIAQKNAQYYFFQFLNGFIKNDIFLGKPFQEFMYLELTPFNGTFWFVLHTNYNTICIINICFYEEMK